MSGGGRKGNIYFCPFPHKRQTEIKAQVRSTMDCSAHQLGTVVHPVTISLDRAAIFFSLCAASHSVNSSTVYYHQLARLLSCRPLLCGHFPSIHTRPHECYSAPAWAARKCGLSCLSLVLQTQCPAKTFLPPLLQG